jgi:hypothetical protein
MIENEQAHGRRQISECALSIDAADQLGERLASPAGDVLQAIPKRFFQADTRLMPSDNDGALDDKRFHMARPYSTVGNRRKNKAEVVSFSSNLWESATRS